MIFNLDSWAKVVNSIKESVTKNTANISNMTTQLGGCHLKYENGKYYIGHDDGTNETEV